MRDTLYDGRPFRTLNVIDEGNREALRIECGTSIPSSRVVRVLEQLVEMFGRPEAIRLDNGPELTAEAFVDWAEKNGVKLLFIQPGKPLLEHPLGAAAIVDGDAWMLRDDGENLYLVHGNWDGSTLTDETSRFDFDLGWIDIDEDGLHHAISMVQQALDQLDQDESGLRLIA